MQNLPAGHRRTALLILATAVTFVGGCEHPANSPSRLHPTPADLESASATLARLESKLADPVRAAALQQEVPRLMARAGALNGMAVNGMEDLIAVARAEQPREPTAVPGTRP